ncbi:TPA: methyl-accepting chemotaxis protein [Photobacterium damselae]
MQWFKNLSFRWKFAIPMAFIVSIFLLIIGFALVVFSNVAESERIQRTEVQPVLDKLEDGYRDLYQVVTAGQGIILAKGDAKLLAYHQFEFEDNGSKALPRLMSVQELIDSKFLPTSTQSQLSQLRSTYEAWIQHYSYMADNPMLAESYSRENDAQMNKEFEQLRSQLKGIRGQIETSLTELRQSIESDIRQAVLSLQIGGFIALMLAIVVVLGVGQVVLAPMQRLRIAMENIATGDGDLTQRVPVESSDELGQLAISFNQFVDKIHVTVQAVYQTINTVSSQAVQIKDTTQTVVERVVDQQEQSALAATAVNEMSATSDTVSQHASEAAQASQLVSDESNAAKVVLHQTVAAINQLSEEIESSSIVISDLERDVSNIASILDVIRGIADQTNLLALNAAIEAARAGEQGRGFAVVADEVRSLASKTQESTGEIQIMIERLQQGANQAVKAMSLSSQSGIATVEQANNANRSLESITDSINVVNEMNLQIATAATQQSQVSEDINLNIQKIADNSQDVVVSSNQCHDIIQDLATKCEQLDSLIRQFKV